MKAAVIGAGSWGTALAQVLAQNNVPVHLWARRETLAKDIKEHEENREYLPRAKLLPNIHISSDLEESLNNADLVVMALPSHTMSKMIKTSYKYLKKGVIVVSASKGLDLESLRRMSEVLSDEIPKEITSNIAVISGPTHAEEVVRGLPTAVVVASNKKDVAENVQDVFMNSNFRVYTNPDVIGVELGGAFKNIIAICSGISDGLNFGDNSRSALMTRGMVEITRLGIRLGANAATFAGLSGIGDLIVTCSSNFSRNRRAGIEIGRGRDIKDIINSTQMVIEGINTTKAAYQLAKRLNIEMPITEQAYEVLFCQKDPKEAVTCLMTRKGKHEIEDIVSFKKCGW